MAEERERVARWTEPTSIQGADLTPGEQNSALRAFVTWQRYKTTGERTELVELGILPADTAASSETAEK